MYPISLVEWAGELLGRECLAGSQETTDAPACQTGASWTVVSGPRQLATILESQRRQKTVAMAKTIAGGAGMTKPLAANPEGLSLKTLWTELAQLRATALCVTECTVPLGGFPATDILTRFIRLWY